jgi:hypothetical protein
MGESWPVFCQLSSLVRVDIPHSEIPMSPRRHSERCVTAAETPTIRRIDLMLL